ncbi:MerR family transcriptional regulator [Brevibacillus fluminis]|uniref:MerR family transcriptional regulator n=1 Tax=Brevibacillus fluminis TaxID=511487 RepID=A0A3M8CXR4_9BACL|nr:MerR family transcriptional regulator [Brevibacillus fluminis]
MLLDSHAKSIEGRFSIGEVAKSTGTTVKTVRYYDEIGLLKPTMHTEGRHRLYTTAEVWRLELILTLRYLNFGIDEIRKIISGEISVSKALDWQIEALSTQQRTLSNMITILQRAKENGIGEDSLHHIHDLVASISANTEDRKKFIFKKIKESMIIDQFPYDWKEPLIQSIDGIFPKNKKITALQSSAWNEMEELLKDSQFHTEFRQSMEDCVNAVQQYSVNQDLWDKKTVEIYSRVIDAVKAQHPPESTAVQEIVEYYASKFAQMLQVPVTPDLLRYFMKVARISGTDRVLRFWELRAILNPDMECALKAKKLLYQGIMWKIAQLEEVQIKKKQAISK